MAEAQAENALELRVPLLVRELWSGNYLAFPVADGALAAYGEAAEALYEVKLFLEENLALASAETIARFAMPSATRLETVEVLVPRGLSSRLEVRAPIAFSSVVIPHAQDSWVHVPRLQHTFHVGSSEDLSEAIRAEIKRMAAARDLGTANYIDLLPSRREWLETLELTVRRRDELPGGAAASLKKAVAAKKKERDAFEVLRSVALPVHERKEAIAGPPLIGRESERAQLERLLAGKERVSAVLIGPELVGKSALVLDYLRSERRAGRTRLMFATSGAQLIAGMSGFGQWQARVQRVMESAETLDAIILLDNLADLFGDRQSGAIDIAGAMRPFLQDGRVRVIGELTAEALSAFEQTQVGFFSALNRIRIEPLSAWQTKQALEARIAFHTENEPDRPNLTPEAVPLLIDLAERYLPYRPFPGKAIRIYEELRAVSERNRTKDGAPEPIDAERLLEAFSLETGIPSFLLREDRALFAEEVVARIRRRMVGQDEAIRRVVETICVVKAALQPPGKPLATFLFIGPTGVGKTELARALAEFLFGSAERMVRFDMSEYMDPYAAERLIQGTARSEGLLTKKIRQQPFCVLLLDEIEKAHPAVLDLLLQVSGEARLTDALGRTAYFQNTIIIMTSNLGAAHRRSAIGIDASPASSEEYFLRQVHRAFRPELVNRLDQIIAFRSLSRDEVRQVARLVLSRIEGRRGFLDSGIRLETSDGALAVLAEGGYAEAYGARALRRHIEDRLIAPASRLIARAEKEARGGTLLVRTTDEPKGARGQALSALEEGPLRLELFRGRDRQARKDEWGVAEIASMRRAADRYLRLYRIEQLKDQIALHLSQLSQPIAAPDRPGPSDGTAAARDRRSERDFAEIQTEYHRLSQLWAKSDALHQDVLVAEELALGALFEGEKTTEYFEVAKNSFTDFQKSLVYLLVALEPSRDQVTMMLQEHDDGRGLDLWLAPLLRALGERGWLAEVHLDQDRAAPLLGWPKGRRFGPPRNATHALEMITAADRSFRNAILRVRGPYAGVLLALEGGLHRWIKVHPEVNPAHLSARVLALRAELTDAEWDSELVQPEAPDPRSDETKHRAVREYDGTRNILQVLDKERRIPLALDRYWKSFEQIALAHLLAGEAGE